MNSRRALALLVLVGLTAPGCSLLKGHDPVWIQGAVEVDTQSSFWAGVLAGVSSSGLPIARQDPDAGIVESQWVFAPYTFANDALMRRESLNQPFRRRAHVKVEEVADGRYLVSVRVEKERNVDEVDPSNELRADWIQDPDDVDKAREILERIRYYRIGE